MDEQAMELAMTIVAQAGDARSSCMEAIAFAKKGQFEQAEQTLQQARSRLSAVGMSKAAGANRRTSSKIPCSLELREAYKASAVAVLALAVS